MKVCDFVVEVVDCGCLYRYYKGWWWGIVLCGGQVK